MFFPSLKYKPLNTRSYGKKHNTAHSKKKEMLE